MLCFCIAGNGSGIGDARTCKRQIIKHRPAGIANTLLNAVAGKLNEK